jgi:HlyD family secretion protein
MFEPRVTAATDSTRAAAPATPSPVPVTARSIARRPDGQLGDRVRSLSLAHMPERRSALATNLVWMAAVAVLALGGWFGYAHFVAAKPTDERLASIAKKAPKTSARPLPATAAVSASAQRPTGSTASSPPAPALSIPPPKGDIALEAKGYIVPAHQILVSPKVSGMIVTLNVEEGRRVNKGDVLAVLETTDYAADFERAKATVRLMREKLRELENGNRPEEIKEAEAELREAEALIPQLEAEYKRSAELRRKNSTTQQEFELAESKFRSQVQRVERLKLAHRLMEIGPRKERIDVAKAELAQAEADVTKAEWRLGNCTIRAPITGTILKKNAEEGNIVNPIAFNGSYSLCDMADLSDLEVDLNIQERDIAVIKVGQKCRVRAEAYPDRIYDGYVDRQMPIADRAKGAIPVRVKIRIPADEEGVYLKPEMGAIVTFLHQQVSAAPDVAAQRAAWEATPIQATP